MSPTPSGSGRNYGINYESSLNRLDRYQLIALENSQRLESIGNKEVGLIYQVPNNYKVVLRLYVKIAYMGC